MTSLRNSNNRPDKVAKRRYVTEYKLARGCSVCGYNKCADALEFDHVDREKKNFVLSDAYKYAWEKIHKELEKCIVLCANCHREKTIKEQDYLETDYEEPEDPQFSFF